MPSQAVGEGFDKVMIKVNLLLDLRKLAEKEEAELRIVSLV